MSKIRRHLLQLKLRARCVVSCHVACVSTAAYVAWSHKSTLWCSVRFLAINSENFSWIVYATTDITFENRNRPPWVIIAQKWQFWPGAEWNVSTAYPMLYDPPLSPNHVRRRFTATLEQIEHNVHQLDGKSWSEEVVKENKQHSRCIFFLQAADWKKAVQQ